MEYMQRNSDFKILFKCCHKVDKNHKGYMFNGSYIEDLSEHLWWKLREWRLENKIESKYELIDILVDIKKRQSKNWNVFMKQPPPKMHPFKQDFGLILTEIEPPGPCVVYNLHGLIIYETYYNLR